jgi:predicted nucleic acid-binding protein
LEIKLESLFEVYKRIKKLKGQEEAHLSTAALSKTTIVPIEQTIALKAADYRIEKNLHFSDTLVYATACPHKANLYTK